jgi:threonylcarbamoyladenosine tRNA methylthiotransferase MtaB
MKKSVALHTLGCKLNYSETSTLAGKFHQQGFEIKKFSEKADIYLLNTCSVTENADKECRQIIRSIINKNPKAYIIVTGCYAQLEPNEAASIKGVDLVLGSKEKFKLFDYINNLEKKEFSCVFTSPKEELTNLDYAYSSDAETRTRAFVKIQDGCDYNCSFCIIPQARGKSRSLDPKIIINNINKLIEQGYKEIVLTGVNTGDYKYKNGYNKNYYLIDLLKELDKQNIPRIRISSIEPNLLNDEIIYLVSQSPKFCRHFHIPLQSGDNEILGLMRRRYKSEDYYDLIKKLKKIMPDSGIGADVITGFPGETDNKFLNTLKFIEELEISYLHVFTYSERKNTHSVRLPNRVNINERRRRTNILRELSDKKKLNFYKNNSDKIHNVLFESIKENKYLYGFTENYIKVRTGKEKTEENSIRAFKIDKINDELIAEGEIV